jgi:tetratricopeptide (TPR) repeat protein
MRAVEAATVALDPAVADTMRAGVARAESAAAVAPRVGALLAASDMAFAGQDLNGCVASLKEALTLDSDDSDVLFRYGRARLAQGAADEAEVAFRRGLVELDRQRVVRPDATTGYQSEMLLGMIAASQNRYDDAFLWFDRAQALNPYQSGAHLMRARTLERLGRHDDARRETEAGLRVDPTNPALLAMARHFGARP